MTLCVQNAEFSRVITLPETKVFEHFRACASKGNDQPSFSRGKKNVSWELGGQVSLAESTFY